MPCVTVGAGQAFVLAKSGSRTHTVVASVLPGACAVSRPVLCTFLFYLEAKIFGGSFVLFWAVIRVAYITTSMLAMFLLFGQGSATWYLAENCVAVRGIFG